MCAREGNPRPLAVTATLTRGTFSLDLDFRVEPGEVIGLTGPIGSGKSSALHLLTGALRATVGSVSHGQTVWDQPANKAFVTDRSVAHLSQFFQNDLPEDLTGVEVVAQSVKKLRPDDPKPEETARVTLAALGLEDHVVDRLPWTFSGAEAQRTALARAVAPRPAVLLLDEPFGALDKRTGVAVRNWLQGWLATFDGCAILASTNTEHLEPLTDRFISLD